jgi:glycosyltransferase involved in cell wall biosynthesis
MERRPIPEIENDGSFKIAFTGAIGYAQGLDVLPRTAELLKEENVKFVIVGDGRYQAEFEKEIKDRGVGDKFILIPRQPAERIPEILSNCDAGFISFMDTELFEKTIPAKLQSYMACGMPILAAAKGETERVVNEAVCGFCSPIGDEKGLAEAVRSLMSANLESMKRNSRKYFEEHFDKQMLMDQMDEHFAAVWR